MGLRDAGWRIVNFACGLGRPECHPRRLAELEEACRRARFELVVADPLADIGVGLHPVAAANELAMQIRPLLARVDLVVSPSPHDGHHGHEVVARAVLGALDVVPHPGNWWLWGLWADLPIPTLFVPITEDRLTEVRVALAAHQGELARNDYEDLIEARARANAILGSERVFGFGSPRLPYRHAELLTALVRIKRRWHLTEPRVLDVAAVVGAPIPAADVDWWLRDTSVRERVRRSRNPSVRSSGSSIGRRRA